MKRPGHTAEASKQTNIMYWTTPEFTKDGSVDLVALKRHLTTRVPNNFHDKQKNNVWEPGKEFQIRFLDKDSRNTIRFRCALTIEGGGENATVVCTLCEQIKTLPLIEGIQKITTEVLAAK